MCTKEEKSADTAAAACGAAAQPVTEMELAFYLDESLRKRCTFKGYTPEYPKSGEKVSRVEVTATATIDDTGESCGCRERATLRSEHTVRVTLGTDITPDLRDKFINNDASVSLKKMLLAELAKRLVEQAAKLDLKAYVASLDSDTAIGLITDVLTAMSPKAGEARNEHYIAVDVYTQLKSLLASHLNRTPVAKPTLKDLMKKVLRLEREMADVAGVPVRLTPTLGEGNLVAAGLAGPWGGIAAEFMDSLRCGGHGR